MGSRERCGCLDDVQFFLVGRGVRMPSDPYHKPTTKPTTNRGLKNKGRTTHQLIRPICGCTCQRRLRLLANVQELQYIVWSPTFVASLSLPPATKVCLVYFLTLYDLYPYPLQRRYYCSVCCWFSEARVTHRPFTERICGHRDGEYTTGIRSGRSQAPIETNRRSNRY
jgi:hypothetical protein